MFGKILLAYDGSENGRRALDVAAELSRNLGAELLIVHVLMHGRPAKELVQMAEVEHLIDATRAALPPDMPLRTGTPLELLESVRPADQTMRVVSALGDQIIALGRDRAEQAGVTAVRTEIRIGDYAEEILDAAQDAKADMIVIGSRGLGTLSGKVLGSVSQKVLHHAPGTVVTVK